MVFPGRLTQEVGIIWRLNLMGILTFGYASPHLSELIQTTIEPIFSLPVDSIPASLDNSLHPQAWRAPRQVRHPRRVFSLCLSIVYILSWIN